MQSPLTGRCSGDFARPLGPRGEGPAGEHNTAHRRALCFLSCLPPSARVGGAFGHRQCPPPLQLDRGSQGKGFVCCEVCKWSRLGQRELGQC